MTVKKNERIYVNWYGIISKIHQVKRQVQNSVYNMLSFGQEAEGRDHFTYSYLYLLNNMYTINVYIYMCVCMHTCICYTHTTSGSICKKTANKHCLWKGNLGAKRLPFLLFLHHLSVFAYSKIHRYVYLYIETKNKSQLRLKEIWFHISYWVLQNLWYKPVDPRIIIPYHYRCLNVSVKENLQPGSDPPPWIVFE